MCLPGPGTILLPGQPREFLLDWIKVRIRTALCKTWQRTREIDRARE